MEAVNFPPRTAFTASKKRRTRKYPEEKLVIQAKICKRLDKEDQSDEC